MHGCKQDPSFEPDLDSIHSTTCSQCAAMHAARTALISAANLCSMQAQVCHRKLNSIYNSTQVQHCQVSSTFLLLMPPQHKAAPKLKRHCMTNCTAVLCKRFIIQRW
jgi:hypothetical protein